MSRSINKVQIIGTLGRDPEMRYMPNGNAVVTVSVATDESYNDKQSGQKVERTEWHRMTAFGKLAEIIGQYLKKGSKAYFEGKLRTNEYEKDGIKRYSTEIVVNDMMMLDGRPAEGQQQGGFAPQPNQMQGQQQGGFAPQQQMTNALQGQPKQQMQSPAGFNQQQYNAQQQQQPVQQGGFQPQPMQQGQQPHSNNFDNFDDDIPF
jgi:single-strand DNA-binding protein